MPQPTCARAHTGDLLSTDTMIRNTCLAENGPLGSMHCWSGSTVTGETALCPSGADKELPFTTSEGKVYNVAKLTGWATPVDKHVYVKAPPDCCRRELQPHADGVGSFCYDALAGIPHQR